MAVGSIILWRSQLVNCSLAMVLGRYVSQRSMKGLVYSYYVARTITILTIPEVSLKVVFETVCVIFCLLVDDYLSPIAYFLFYNVKLWLFLFLFFVFRQQN